MNRKIMKELVWCFEKLQKSQMVGENFLFPSYGDKVNEFNEFLKVTDVESKQGRIFINLVRP